MKIIADALITLPFKLDFCAKGSEIEPLTCYLGGMNAALYFPPSLSEGTDGQGIFGDWAWWKGQSLRLILECETESADDVAGHREAALNAGNEVLRRFLNAYRWRFGQAEVHPVRIDPTAMDMAVIDNEGHRSSLTEPFESFFYRSMPDSPPLDKSVNVESLLQLRSDICGCLEPPVSDMLDLDADALEAQGERKRAELLRSLLCEM